MGEMLCGEIMMKTVDGREIHIENAIINELSVEPEVKEIFNPEDDFGRKEVINNNYELSLTIGNITRKRFIKLLMSKGIARNGAKDIASYVYKKYGYYNPIHLLMI